MHRLEYNGKFLTSSGTFTVPRSPQGHPVVIQAGASARGKTFAARWAETVFVGYPDLEEGKRQYAEFKTEIARLGRDPDLTTVNTIAYPVVAETRSEAEDKMALIDSLYKEVDGLSLLSEAMNFDFKTKGMDEAFTTEELEGMSGMQAMRDRVMRVIGHNPTVRDFLEVTRRGRPREAVVGSGKDIADRLEQWFTERACDGFVIAGTHMPGSFEDFVRLSCRNCSGAACIVRSIPARRCGKTWACRCRRGARGTCPKRPRSGRIRRQFKARRDSSPKRRRTDPEYVYLRRPPTARKTFRSAHSRTRGSGSTR